MTIRFGWLLVSWSRTFGSASADDTGIDVVGAATDAFVVGSFVDSFTLDSVTLNSASGSRDGFVLSLAEDGMAIWGTNLGGTGEEYATAVTARDNELYLAGIFSGTVGR